MFIKASTALRYEYTLISDVAKKTGEPIFITKKGEGDLVLMSIAAYRRYENLMRICEEILCKEAETALEPKKSELVNKIRKEGSFGS